jgi:hypothetical protein
MRGGAEAEEADALAVLDAGDAKAAEADDSGAQQRSGMERVECGGDGKYEIGAREGVFGVASVDGVASESGGVAEVFLAAKAVGAGAVGSAEPGDADAGSGWCLVGQECPTHTGVAGFDYLADDLVAGGDSRVKRREFAFGDVEIGAADSAG